MRSAATAEWILSLVAAPDRAASTIGDLVEEASSRGILWFWSSVLRTACSHCWRGLCAAPLRMVGLAFWGLAASWVLNALLAVLVIGLWLPVPLWVYSTCQVVVCTAIPLLVGWEVARRSAGRDLPAAFAVAFLLAAYYVVSLYRSATPVRYIGRPWPGTANAFPFLVFCAQALFVIAGAMLFRRRTLAKATSAC